MSDQAEEVKQMLAQAIRKLGLRRKVLKASAALLELSDCDDVALQIIEDMEDFRAAIRKMATEIQES